MSVGSIYFQYRNANIMSRAKAEAGTADKSASDPVKKATESSETSLRKLESQSRTKEKQSNSVVEQSMSYARQLSATRTRNEKSSLEKKKLQYSFKKLSSQIIRSKTSVSARKAVQAARREVTRLKRLANSGEYDEEELQLAIDHAKAMEKVAKKKVSHLEQEEMVERHGKGLSGELEETEEQREAGEEEKIEDTEDEELIPEGEQEEYLPEEYDEYQEEMSLDISDTIEDFDYEMDRLMDEMSQMLEELDLEELARSTYAPDPNMSEDDLKMLKIKHRYKELKEIAQADKEYLKGIMEHEKNKQAGEVVGAATGTAGTGPSAVFKAGAPSVTPVISMPGAAAGGMPAPTISGGFDVSV